MIDVAEDVQEAIVKDLLETCNVKMTARKYGLTYPYVYRLATKHKVPLHRGRPMGTIENGLLSDRTMLIVDALKHEDNMAEVARQFGVTRERVRQIAVKFNLHPNRRHEVLREANEKLAAPLIEALKYRETHCPRCGGYKESHGPGTKFCAACSERRHQIRCIIRDLYYYRSKKFGDSLSTKRSLNQAAWAIRTYDITPEEIKNHY